MKYRIPVSDTMPNTCLYYYCRVDDAIRLTRSSQIVVPVWCHHVYRHWLFSYSIDSGDVLITNTNRFCSCVGQVTLPSPQMWSKHLSTVVMTKMPTCSLFLFLWPLFCTFIDFDDVTMSNDDSTSGCFSVSNNNRRVIQRGCYAGWSFGT
jgi:hypothetical protein